MKSIVVTGLMFLGVMAAIHYHVFDALSSAYAYGFGVICLGIALFFAFKILGNPIKTKGDGHDKK
ncbi:MAG: hypothetical protein IKR60_00295 [Alphaproteobacteria bacterium]|nr:hypothetical protein [Alphaproteobacteria bacterium]MBR6327301.1 hypothetical protein [Alphaproteobacteria bacterium]